MTLSAQSPFVFGVPQSSELQPALFTLCSQPLPDVISADECDFFHKYADDTELSQSAQRDEFCSVQTDIQTCIDDVLFWMNSNKLMLNTNKKGTNGCWHFILPQPGRLRFGKHRGEQYSLQNVCEILGVKIDQTFSMQNQISNVCRASFLELRRLASIRPYLSKRTAAALVAALITSRLDYCNCLSRFAKLTAEGSEQCSSARSEETQAVHIKPLMSKLHQLPVKYEIAKSCLPSLRR